MSWSTGYKSGAFQYFATAPLIASQIAEPEDVESIEVGLRSTLADGRIRFNIAAFDMDYQELQQLRLVPVAPGVNLVYIDNAASSAIRGVEAETQFLLSENWSMEINFGYLDATFDEYVFAQALDFSGNTMPRAPEHTLAIALNYSAPVAWGQVDARLAYAWRDKVYFEADNNVVDPESSEDSLGLLDFSVALTASDWTFSLWGHNLSDERYRRSTLNSTGSAQKGIWAEPRTYGLKVQYDFGQ